MTTDHIPDARKMMPAALRLADYWERRAQDLQTWVDENDYVEFGYRPEGLKREQAGQREVAAELRRLHAELEATDRQVEILTDELSKCSKENAKLRALLSDLVKVCEHHDQSIADLLGRPVGWKDTYLDKARAALKERLK